MRNNLIVICCVFVFFLLMLIPSYSAIRIRTSDNKVINELIDKEEVVDFGDLEEKVNFVNTLKYPILFDFVKAIFGLRIIRCMILFELSTEVDYSGWQPYYEIIHPLLYSRAYMLGLTAWIWLESWYFISQIFDWGWIPGPLHLII